MFRYPSCSFRRDPNKATTARALIGRISGLAYTLEVSNWAYYKKDLTSDKNVDIESLVKLGQSIVIALFEFMENKILLKKKILMKLEEK